MFTSNEKKIIYPPLIYVVSVAENISFHLSILQKWWITGYSLHLPARVAGQQWVSDRGPVALRGGNQLLWPSMIIFLLYFNSFSLSLHFNIKWNKQSFLELERQFCAVNMFSCFDIKLLHWLLISHSAVSTFSRYSTCRPQWYFPKISECVSRYAYMQYTFYLH